MKDLTLQQNLALAEFLTCYFAGVREQDLNPAAVSEMTVGERIAARMAGQRLAWVSLPNSAVRASVKDPGAFLAWVREHKPDEVETIERVRPASQAAILKAAKARGGKLLDPATGELVPVAGIEIAPGRLTPRVELAEDAKDIIASAWRAGEIDLGGILAIAPIAAEPEQAEAAASEPEAPWEDIAWVNEVGAPDLAFADEHGFLNPELAAAHAVIVQHGYSTPPIEAYRMMRDGGTGAERARAWLEGHGLDPGDPHRGKNTPWPLPVPDGGERDA